MLKRDISRFGSYATLVGMMVGAGIFVAIGEAGRDAGPSTWLAYLLLGPVTLLVAMPYMIFHTTSIGGIPGGAYIHISRTFKSTYLGFIVSWLMWVTYLGVLATLAISAGHYLNVFLGGIDPRIIATACLLFFFMVNIVGVKYFDRLQSIMFILLIGGILALVLPGIFAVRAANFTPFMPKGIDGFLTALPVLFFAYCGFEALAQTAGEVEHPQQELPRVFFRGVLVSVALYVSISVVAFGTLPYVDLVRSHTPIADAAKTFLPYGSHIVSLGAVMAFFTTINAGMLAPSRLLFAFAEDRIIPPAMARLNDRFNTPHVSLIVTGLLAVVLVWTKTVGMLISIAMQSIIIMYVTECAAMAALPHLNKELWNEVPFKLRPMTVSAAGIIGIVILAALYMRIPNPLNPMLIGWFVLGTLIYAYERLVQNRRAARELVDQLRDVFPTADGTGGETTEGSA